MIFRAINILKDKDTIIEFRKDTYLISFGSLEGFDEVSYIERITERVNSFPDGQLIIEDSGKAIGQIGLVTQNYKDRDIGYVNLYYIIKEYRNKGIGQKLISFTENYFKGLNLYEYHLRVSAQNEDAIRFYTKSGLTKLMEEKNDEQVLWRMGKKL